LNPAPSKEDSNLVRPAREDVVDKATLVLDSELGQRERVGLSSTLKGLADLVPR